MYLHLLMHVIALTFRCMHLQVEATQHISGAFFFRQTGALAAIAALKTNVVACQQIRSHIGVMPYVHLIPFNNM